MGEMTVGGVDDGTHDFGGDVAVAYLYCVSLRRSRLSAQTCARSIFFYRCLFLLALLLPTINYKL